MDLICTEARSTHLEFLQVIDLDNGTLIRCFRNPYYAIVSNMTHSFRSVCHERKKWPVFKFLFYLYPYFTFRLPFDTVKFILKF